MGTNGACSAVSDPHHHRVSGLGGDAFRIGGSYIGGQTCRPRKLTHRRCRQPPTSVVPTISGDSQLPGFIGAYFPAAAGELSVNCRWNMGTQAQRDCCWTKVPVFILLVVLLYLCSLGPVQVLEHRTCRTAGTREAVRRYEQVFGAYMQPGICLVSLSSVSERIAARYVHWWVAVTHTPRPWRSAEYWYDY